MGTTEIQIGRGLRIVFLGVGLLTFLVGSIMFFLPGPAGVGSGGASAPPAGDQWWPWPLRTVLNTRFLGALFVGVGVGAFWAARQRFWHQVRGLFPPGITFTALATIASFMSWPSFNTERITTWAFFAVYIIVLIAGIVTFVQYERQG